MWWGKVIRWFRVGRKMRKIWKSEKPFLRACLDELENGEQNETE